MRRYLAAIAAGALFASQANATTIGPFNVTTAPVTVNGVTVDLGPLLSAPPLIDIGFPSSCPKILVKAGQSNAEGFDDGGSKTIQSGVYITNAVAGVSATTPVNPTTIIPAAFGTAPLNRGLTGIISTSGAAYNNSEIHFANDLVSNGFAPLVQSPTDPTIQAGVVIVANWYPGQSISNWVGATPGTMDPAAQYWAQFVAAMTVVEAKFPGCPITQYDWDQGEQDSWTVSTGYNSAATYQLGLSTLIAAVKALTISGHAVWNTDTTRGHQSTITLQELATWGDNWTENARNDVIDTYRGGAKDPSVDVIPVDGLIESSENPGPHFDGASLIELGHHLMHAYRATRVGGGFAERANTQTTYGSADAYGNVIQGPNSGSLLLGVQDFRTGGLIYMNGGTVSFPHPSEFALRPVVMEIFGGSAGGLIDFSTTGGSSGFDETKGAGVTSTTILAATRWEAKTVNGTWRMSQKYPLGGVSTRYSPVEFTADSAQILLARQTYNVMYLTNNNPITITPQPGGSMVLTNNPAAGGNTTLIINPANDTAGARVIEPDGTVRQTSISGGYPVLPGATVHIAIDNGFNLRVISDSARIEGVNGVQVPKLSAAPTTAPGAGQVRLFGLAGTNAGSCKVMAQAGTSATAVLVTDNVGSGC